MYTELTKNDIRDCLIEGGLIYDFRENPAVREEDICYLTYLHTNNLAQVLAEFARDCAKDARTALEVCLRTPNENFRITKEVTDSRVNVEKLIELRPDVYRDTRRLADRFIHRAFTPYRLIELFRENGISEEEIRANVRVNVGDVRGLLHENEAQAVIYPVAFSYTVEEADE